MRDAFGGAFMLKVIMVFVVIYVTFMCIALNYARAFRVKNRVINILEQYQYGNANTTEDAKDAIRTYVDQVHYKVRSKRKETTIDCEGEYLEDCGICILGIGDDDARYYKVTSYIVFNLPFFDAEWALPVRGETRTIDIIVK